MKAPPYAKSVIAGNLRTGHKLLLFAGPKAWDASRWYLGRGAECESRQTHILLLPPDQTAHAAMFNWPVRRKDVVVVSTLDNDAQLLPLFGALQRDAAQSIELYACDASIGTTELEWQLLCIHWGHPFAPPAPARADLARAA
jgi:hypothetical protein